MASFSRLLAHLRICFGQLSMTYDTTMARLVGVADLTFECVASPIASPVDIAILDHMSASYDFNGDALPHAAHKSKSALTHARPSASA